jgi:hypothetical protein
MGTLFPFLDDNGSPKESTKVCAYCEEEKPLSQFNLNKGRHDGRDHRCTICQYEAAKKVAELKKSAPPMPEHCDCCGIHISKITEGRRNKKFSCDHDHETGEFRGWLCPNCNSGIGGLQDTIDGVVTALIYLLKNKSFYVKIKKLIKIILCQTYSKK